MTTEPNMNIKTGFGKEVHKAKRVPFVIHKLFGKITEKEAGSPIFIPKCSGFRIRVSLDHLHRTSERVTCSKCGA